MAKAIAIAASLMCCGVQADSLVRAGPVDIGIEPLLVRDTAVYRGTDGLYWMGRGIDVPQPLGSRLDSPRVRVFSPDVQISDGRLTAAWLEKWPDGNRLRLASCRDRAACRQASGAIAEPLGSTLVRLEQVGDERYLLDAALGKQPSVSLTRLSDTDVIREALPIPSLEELGAVATCSRGRTLYAFFSARLLGSERLAMLEYDTETKRVLAVETVAETPFTPLMEALILSGKPAVFFKVYTGGRFALNLAVRESDGWRISAVSGADGLDVARLDWQDWPDGRLLLVFSGEQREQTKQRVYAAVSDDGGVQWRTRQLDAAEFTNTRAWLPRLTVAGERVAVVWEDARDIRARIRMQLSQDRGETWLARDLALSPENAYAMRPRIDHVDDELYIAWHQYHSDARERADLVLKTLTWDEAWAQAERRDAAPRADDRQSALASAVEGVWTASVAGDQRFVYDTYDPFYRAKVGFERHVASARPVSFAGYALQDLVIRGNEAQATILAELPPERDAPDHQRIRVSAVRYPIRETWLYVDGRWYRKFVDDVSGASAIAY